MDARRKMPDDDPQTIIRNIATTCLKRADGDVLKATNLMEAEIHADDVLYHILMDPLVRTACYNVITGICRHQRRAVWHPPQPSKAQQKKGIVALATAYLTFALPGGLPLGDATKVDVAEAAVFYSRQANDMGEKARWLTMIEQRMPAKGKKKVRDFFGEKDLADLKRKATGA